MSLTSSQLWFGFPQPQRIGIHSFGVSMSHHSSKHQMRPAEEQGKCLPSGLPPFFFFKYKGRAILVGAGEGESLHLAHWSGHGYISPGSRAFLYTAPRGAAWRVWLPRLRPSSGHYKDLWGSSTQRRRKEERKKKDEVFRGHSAPTLPE